MEDISVEDKKLFLNVNYCSDLLKNHKYKIYTNNNGIIKECVNTIFIKRLSSIRNFYFALSELPIEIQNKYRNDAVDLVSDNIKKQQYLRDKDGNPLLISDKTQIIPIVDNILVNDGVLTPYAIEIKNGKRNLKPILVCLDCHWSDLFGGNSRYGENVFCLVEDLEDDVKEKYCSEIITIGDVPDSVINPTKDKHL